jgi:hypothetical protein
VGGSGVSVGSGVGVSTTSGVGVFCCTGTGVGVATSTSGNNFIRRGVLVGVGVTCNVAMGPHASIGAIMAIITPTKNLYRLLIVTHLSLNTFFKSPDIIA